ncbi:histidinol-phosphatase [Treponema sp.]|uniref:histidinol-phosphatase n=1 Tax=Treponema sp. TaxID=166 RepID=UPI003F08E859
MKPISNFHTHTELCHHAQGRPVDYVSQAMQEECAALGFSDHCPYPDDFFDCWPEIRMTEKEASLYRSWIEEAREISSFPVFMGYECEWEPSYGGWYDELRDRFHADYLVLGSHWVTDGASHVYIPDVESPSLLNRYIDQTIEGMRSGCFDFLAHPDLFMAGYKEWDEQSKACSRAILDAAVDLDLPIEVNGLGITRLPNNTKHGMRYPYPFVEFWEMASLTNVRVVCNSDAHNPQDVILNAWKARDFAGRFGIMPLEQPDFCTR